MPTKSKMEMKDGMCCGCMHHKITPGLTFVVAGAVLLYTGSWAWTLIAFGLMKIIGKSMCKCCNGMC